MIRNRTILTVILWLAAGVTAPALCRDGIVDTAGPAGSGGWMGNLRDRVSFAGLVEWAAGYRSTACGDDCGASVAGFRPTRAEAGVEVAVLGWIRAETVFLYEDPFGEEGPGLCLDTGTVTFGDSDRFPLYASAGRMRSPYGILGTRFPDIPAVSQPLTQLLGETCNNAALLGYSRAGLSLSGYLSSGGVKRTGGSASAAYGIDARYARPENGLPGLVAGVSYISNIAGAAVSVECIGENAGAPQNPVRGLAATLTLDFRGFFLVAGYMTALAEGDPAELARPDGRGARPSAWDCETGYGWGRGRNLELVLRYAESDGTAALGLPRKRYGFSLIQEIARGVAGSFAFVRDQGHGGGIDGRQSESALLLQVSVEF